MSFLPSDALIGAKKREKADRLIGSIDSFLGEIDEDTQKVQMRLKNIVKDTFQQDAAGAQLIKSFNEDNQVISQDYEALLRSLNQDLIFELRPFQYFEVITKELAFDRAIVSISLLKEQYSNLKVPIISYFVPVPCVPSQIILRREIPKETKMRSKKQSDF